MKTDAFLISLLLAPGFSVLAQGAQFPATVEITTAPCRFQAKQLFAGAKLSYWLTASNGGTVAVMDISWNSADRGQLRWTAHVPAGVYRYHVYGNVHPTDTPCGVDGSFAILPGATRRIDAKMQGGIWDPIVPLYIYGTAPADVKVALVRFDNRPDCGTLLSTAQYHSINVERDGVGYYAEDTSLSGSGVGQNVVFGVRIQGPGQVERTIRLVASYPTENIAVPPSSKRMDLSLSAIDAANKSSADHLICVTENLNTASSPSGTVNHQPPPAAADRRVGRDAAKPRDRRIRP